MKSKYLIIDFYPFKFNSEIGYITNKQKLIKLINNEIKKNK